MAAHDMDGTCSVIRGLVALVEDRGLADDAEARELLSVARNCLMNLELAQQIEAEAKTRADLGARRAEIQAAIAGGPAVRALPVAENVYRNRRVVRG